MESMSSNPLFTDLTASEVAALNGGYYCRVVQVWRCYWWYGRRFCRWILQTRCF